MIATNALVTWDNLSVMGLTAKAGVTPPTGNRVVTKGEANTYYWLDNNAYPFSTYTNLRCPRYQDIVPLTPPVICNLWETYDPAYFEYIDCNGTYQYQYLDYGSTICVQNGYFVTGPIYNTGNFC